MTKRTVLAALLNENGSSQDLERQYYQATASITEAEELLATALIDHNYEGIVTSAGSVTKWLNTANRSQAAYFDGSSYISTPDSGALALTGDVQTWTWYGVAAADFTPGGVTILGGQYDTTLNQRSWQLTIDNSPAGVLQAGFSVNGSGGFSPSSTIAPSFTDGVSYDIQMNRVVSTGVVTFYTCVAGGTFTQLGDPVTDTTGALFAATCVVTIGARLDNGTTVTSPFTGTIQRFTLHDDDRLAASWSADDYTDYNATTMLSADNTPFAFDGVAGSYISTPDSAAASVTGDCILYGYVQPSDNTPTGLNTIISKWVNSSLRRGFLLGVDNSPTSGSLTLLLSQDGTATTTYNSTVVTGIADGIGYWAFAVIDIGTNVTFYTSLSAPTVSPSSAYAAASILGTAVTVTETSIKDNAEPVEIGANSSIAGYDFNGQIYRAGIISGLDPTVTPSVDCDSRYAGTTSTFVSSDGATYTLNGGAVKQGIWTLNNGAIIRDPYDMDVLLGTGGLRRHDSGAVLLNGVSGSYVSAPDSPANSITGDCILYGYVQPVDNTPTDRNTIIGKWDDAGGNNRSYLFNVDNNVTGTLEVILSTDGVASSVKSSTVAVPYADGVGYWAFAVIDINSSIKFYTASLPSTAGVSTAFAAAAQLGATVTGIASVIYDGPAVLEVGSYNTGTTANLNGQIHRAGIINGILPQGLEFGEEIIPDPSFDTWTSPSAPDGWVASGTDANNYVEQVTDGLRMVSDGTYTDISIADGLVVGAEYNYRITVDSVADAAAIAGFGGTFQSLNAATTYTGTFTAASAPITLARQGATGAVDIVISEFSVKPTAALAVDFNPALAGRSATGLDSDKFFGAEMLKPSARTINETDWTRGGSGFITDNGDGTVTLSDTDNGGSVAAWVNDNIVANDSTKIKLTVTIKEGTALETDIRLTYTGGTTVSAQYRYTWATGVLSTISAGVSGEAAVNSDGSVTVTVVAQNNSTGNTTCTPRLYPATSLGSTQGSTIFYNNVSLQAEWTLNGGAKIQNSGQAVVQAGGVGGIETTVAPANIPTPMTMFMVGKADLLNGGVFTAARNDSSAGPFIQATIATFNFNAGSVITKTSDTGFHLHTVRHNGDATTSYQIDSGTPVVGDAGAEPYNFGTFFSDLAAGSKLTGSMGRFLLFDEELSDAEVAFIQTLLLPN